MSRCPRCKAVLGPEDCDQPGDVCFDCNARATAWVEPEHPSATLGRQRKALAMAAVIDANFIRQFPKLDPFDQAGRILVASWDWDARTWEDIGENALKPNGEHYERKEISVATKDAVRSIYQGRAQAPVQSRRVAS